MTVLELSKSMQSYEMCRLELSVDYSKLEQNTQILHLCTTLSMLTFLTEVTYIFNARQTSGDVLLEG